jgi:hypothetical protein
MMGTSIRMSKGVSCWPTQFLRTTGVMYFLCKLEHPKSRMPAGVDPQDLS